MKCPRCKMKMVGDDTGSFWYCVGCDFVWCDDDDVLDVIDYEGTIGGVQIWDS